MDIRDTSGFKHRGVQYASMTFGLADAFGAHGYKHISFTPLEHTWGKGLQRNDAFVGADTQRFRDFRDGYLLIKGDVLHQYFIGGGDEYFDEDSSLMKMVVRGATVSEAAREALIEIILHQYDDKPGLVGSDDDGYPRTKEEAQLYLNALINTSDGDTSAADDKARRDVARARKEKKRPREREADHSVAAMRTRKRTR